MRRYVLSFCAAVLTFSHSAAAAEAIGLVALDREGHPVADLKSSEVQLLEDGREQPIASFRLLDPTASPIVVLFDLMNTATGSRGDTRRQIVESMQRAAAPAPLVGLYLVTADGRLSPVHGLDAGAGVAWTAQLEARLDSALRHVPVIRPNYLDRIGARVKATYAMLAELSKLVEAYPGRKTIVWITHGVPLHAISGDGVTVVDYLPTLKKLAAAFGEVQMAIYPVYQARNVLGGADDSSIDTLAQFANITGGRLFRNSRIDDAVASAVSDTAVSYRITYESSAGMDGKYHAIQVNCTRAGIRVLARGGYYADR